jgi:signal transduction histidine kinase
MASLEHGVLKVRSCQRRGDGEDWVCVEIGDSGGGIPEEVCSSIFKPFFSTKSRGTGLGLAIAKRIVEEFHGGRIEVSNNLPQGAVFVVSLPVTQENLKGGSRESKA